jgi:hypothetical protein
MAPIFGNPKEKPAPLSGPVPLNWARNKNGNFFKFATFDPDRAGMSKVGVYVIWHSGAKPGWVMVGSGVELTKRIRALLDDPEVLEYNARGGLYISWAPVLADYHAGVIKYLRESMKPLINRDGPSPEGVEAIPVTAPGTKGETPG